jgi:hypothetical protein
MHLRDHPLMTRKSGYVTWPPKWTTTHHDQSCNPVGEVGVLEQAIMNELFDNRVFLFMMYQGFRYMGALQFDDPVFCYQMYDLLKFHVGRSIKDIGGLNLSGTL